MVARLKLKGIDGRALYGVFNPDFYFEEIRVFQAGIRLEYISME